MPDFINVNGLRFRVDVEHDDWMGAPWDEHDGHGVVSSWTTRGKRAGEKILTTDRQSKRLYDVRASLIIARRDDWGISEESRGDFVARNRREPTAREIAALAVEDDFQRLHAWCNGEWSWVSVTVTLQDASGSPTDERENLGGIESDAGEYLTEVAAELANVIAARIGDATELTRTVSLR